jgi:SNF2 family DNA or RNA helicase
MPKLRDFQQVDVAFTRKNKLHLLNASAPGTGKTIVAVVAVAREYRWSFPCLIACPASVLLNWARECRKWAPGFPVTVITDSTTPLPKKRGFYIASWAMLEARQADFLRLGIKSIVADEAHYAKNPDSQRSRGLKTLAQSSRSTMLLTGTPIVNTRAELAVLQDLLGTANPPMIRRLLEDVAPDIPQKSRSSVYIELRDKHRLDYEKADRRFEDWLRKEKEKLFGSGMAEAEVERILSVEALAKIGYLRRLLGVAKVPAAVDWIARAVRVGEPVVVFLEHQAVLHKLEKGLRKQRIRYGIVEGKTTPKQRQKVIDDFQQHAFPVFIGTKAAKEGITLTAARNLLFLERYFTSADEEQAEDRIRRIGQTHKTTIWFLHALNTVDDRVSSIVQTKRQIVRTAIGLGDVNDTKEGNVRAMIQSWGAHVAPAVKVESLGHGKPLPALPPPRETYAIVFSGKRWQTSSARVWCKMNGYLADRKVSMLDRFKLVVHPPDFFRKGQFKTYRVSKDIKIITGVRLDKANERRVRSATQRGKSV